MLFIKLISIIFPLIVGTLTEADNKLLIQLKEPTGYIRGHVLKSAAFNDYYAFQEIPYAAPPVGENRFKPPKKHDGWTGILDTTKNTKVCKQHYPYLDLKKSEDCLYINVYTPAVQSEEKFPVLVFFHGGSLIMYGGIFQEYNPKFLMDHGVIVVTLNYRLGPFGFLATGDGVIPGNLGLKDQHFALEWIQKNIELFNGDPNKVTIWGESAGSRSVSYHLLSRKSQGLFRAAMSFSGTAVARIAYTPYQKENALNLAKALDPLFNSTSSTDILELLMSSSGEEILKADSKVKCLEEDIGFFENTPWNAVVENENDTDAFLTAPFHESLLHGQFTRVPLLYGFDSEEILLFMKDVESAKKMAAEADKDDSKLLSNSLHIAPSEKLAAGREIKKIYTNTTFKEDLAAYIRFCSDSTLRMGTLRAAELSSEHVPVYLWQFSHSGYACVALGDNYSIPGIEKVGHFEELFYIWKIRAFEPFTPQDRLISKRLTKLITNFVKYLNPTPTTDELLENISWPTVKKDTMEYLNINGTLDVRSNPTRFVAYRDTLLKYIQKPFDIFS